MARKKLRRRLAHGGAVGAGFLVRTALVGAAAFWLFDRERGAERRQRVMSWARSLLGRARAREAHAQPGARGEAQESAEPRGGPARAAPRGRPGASRAAATDETEPLRLRSAPVSEGLLGVSWQAQGDTGREPADDIRTDEDRDRADVDRHALRDPPPRGDNDDGG